MRIARYAFTESAKDDSVQVSIWARDDQPTSLLGEVKINLLGDEERTRADVLRRLDAIDAALIPPHTNVGVTDNSGDGLTGSEGLPSQERRDLWASLNADRFPGRVGFDLATIADHTSMINAEIPSNRTTDGADASDLAALLRHVIDVMRTTHSPFRFHGVIGLDGGRPIWFDSTECTLQGPDWLDQVKRDYFDDDQCH